MNNKLSVVIATRNEEDNIGNCLASVKEIADEIIVVDENSNDKTREIAKDFGAKVFLEPHHEIFHITKQRALDLASNEWILQLDADEVVTKSLSEEIVETLTMQNNSLLKRRDEIFKENPLFNKHQKIMESRNKDLARKDGEVVAFFIPRLNMFLGRPLRHAGVYPDPAIRLIKKNMAFFPSKSVHEIMTIKGQCSWLKNPMEHHDSPSFARYIKRANRYTSLTAEEFNKTRLPKNTLYLFYYSLLKPILVFFNLFLRHRGYLDGTPGFIWSMFSAIHFPLAYYKYWIKNK